MNQSRCANIPHGVRQSSYLPMVFISPVSQLHRSPCRLPPHHAQSNKSPTSIHPHPINPTLADAVIPADYRPRALGGSPRSLLSGLGALHVQQCRSWRDLGGFLIFFSSRIPTVVGNSVGTKRTKKNGSVSFPSCSDRLTQDLVDERIEPLIDDVTVTNCITAL